MNAFQKRNFKLLVDPIEQGASCYEQDESRQIVSATKSLLLEKQDHFTIVRRHISVNAFFKTN